jgi:hypothetical protein
MLETSGKQQPHVFFKIRGDFKPFSGVVKKINGEINGVAIPHVQVKDDNQAQTHLVALSQKTSRQLGRLFVGKQVSFCPDARGNTPGIFLLDFDFTDPVTGQVTVAETFLFGDDLFFSLLLIDTGSGYCRVCFRPYRKQKKQGLELVGKTITVKSPEELFVLEGERGEQWPRR